MFPTLSAPRWEKRLLDTPLLSEFNKRTFLIGKTLHLGPFMSRLLTCFTAVCVAASGVAWAASGNPDDTFGVIEVGSSGIKALVVEQTPNDPEGSPTRTLKQYDPVDKNAFTVDAAASGRVSEAVKRIHQEMQDEFKLPKGHFFVVGSSGLPAEVRRALTDTIYDDGVKMDFITPEMEARYEFQGIVPRGRYSEVVLVDIGSGNTKGGYVEKLTPEVMIATFNIALGTKTYAQEINKARGDGAFRVTAEVLRKEKLIPLIAEPVQQFPGLQTSPRLYLAGGICWAMATLLHPNSVDSAWTTLNKDEIKSFCERAMSNPRQVLTPSFDKVDAKVLDKVKEETARIGKVFNEDQLMAGAQILLTFLDRIHYQEKKAIFFARRGLYAWPAGYVLEKIQAK